MVARTSTAEAPWDLVSAESKRHARVAVLRTVIERVEAGMRAAGQEPPDPVRGPDA